MAELLMWIDKGGSFFWACCALNGFSDRGFASVSGLPKQRPSPPGVPGFSLMDRWITPTLTNHTPVSSLTAGPLGCREAMKTFWEKGNQIWRNCVKKSKRKHTAEDYDWKRSRKIEKCLVGKGTRENR